MFLKGKITPEEFQEIKVELMASSKAEVIEYEHLPEKSEASFGCEIEI